MGKYKELIERVEVTDDMRCRILDHISREPIERPERILPLAGLRRYMAVAACFVVLVAGAVMIPAVLHHNPSSPDQGVLTAPVLLNAASAVELSEWWDSALLISRPLCLHRTKPLIWHWERNWPK